MLFLIMCSQCIVKNIFSCNVHQKCWCHNRFSIFIIGNDLTNQQSQLVLKPSQYIRFKFVRLYACALSCWWSQKCWSRILLPTPRSCSKQSYSYFKYAVFLVEHVTEIRRADVLHNNIVRWKADAPWKTSLETYAVTYLTFTDVMECDPPLNIVILFCTIMF